MSAFRPPLLASRRHWLTQAAAGGVLLALPAAALALPPRTFAFPRDFGSHPELGTEWWYITGQVLAQGRLLGFQLTFFRTRVPSTQNLRSAFAARQLVFGHAALTDVAGRRQLHAQHSARAGMGLAHAREGDTDVQLGSWFLRRTPAPSGTAAQASRYEAHLTSDGFVLDLQLATTQPVLLQGQAGLSRKGPDVAQASYYYSQPQLTVAGRITLDGKVLTIDNAPSNRAWLDHEASDALMHPDAQGWDWIGMNLDDGSALTAFRLRRADGSSLWAGGSWRAPGQVARIFTEREVVFAPHRWWTSPASGARYPVEWRITTPVGSWLVQALLDAQELDSRASTGTIYWEGLCDLRETYSNSLRGRGYLEMTGYAQRLKI
ncbi:lipocalin-like domain-containing protein [Comamonas endophytica]|uniref:Carotenoid 1,2-hydratase n=1 Tax=Comamonas endophytica TaxID=2949090 RepID=A0ABY6GBT6_9BURK|nr:MULTISPECIES: carotenoid 1,2-hydratase [unclassified Acidovorax]MCD2513608.1 carotenoid 1,2-hydratase [Acidovorax sp. D4N7]UYG52383.1 carotenoid 1,2-hydratase [Acidovorax sp. 5MLIR]